MAPSAAENCDSKRNLIFVYGTLKRGFPNHFLLEDLIGSNDAVPMISSSSSYTYRTVQPYPLVRGPLGIPYLLNIGGSGQCIRGELYSVSARGLDRLDELEGISYGHYERLPIKVKMVHVRAGEDQLQPEPEIIEAAEAYFAHRSYAEDMWRKTGKVGIEEYTTDDVASYIKVEDRPAGVSFVEGIRAFVSSSD